MKRIGYLGTSSRSMKSLLIYLVFLLGISIATANPRVDSLLSVLSRTEKINERSMLYNHLARAIQSENLDSAFWYARQGLQIAEKQEDSEGIAQNARTIAALYVSDDRLEEAKTYYSEAIRHFQLAGDNFEFTWTSMVRGNIYLVQDKYVEALQIYQQCLKFSEENDYQKILPHLNNNMGVLYLRLNEYGEAFPYFEKAFQIFEEQEDNYNAANVLSNLADILYQQGKETEALQKYLEAMPVFLELKSWYNVARTYDRIAGIHLVKEEFEEAREYLGMAVLTLENNTNNFVGPRSIGSTSIYTHVAHLAVHDRDFSKALHFARLSYRQAITNSYQENITENAQLISEIFEELNQPDSALAYFKIYNEYKDQLLNEENLKKITRLKMQYEFDGILQKNELERVKKEATYKQKEYIYIGLIVFVLLSISIVILLYNIQKNKTAKALLEQDNLTLEKEKLNQELAYKRKELTTNMMYLLEKNEFILSIARKLEELKTDVKKGDRMLVQQIVNELKRNSSQKAWEEFEVRFMEVHAGFYKALNQKFPTLSPNEQKLCAFLRLNMSSKEISAITYQSTQSINQARFRLRKKMEMERDENLISFLTQL